MAAPAGAVEAAEIDDEVMSRVLTLARHTYDYVIVDSFPLLDRVMMAVLDLSDRAYVVLEAVVPTVLGVAQMLKLVESLAVPSDRLRVVLNRYTGSTDNLKPADVARRLGRPVDYVLPFQKNVGIAANVGRPYILTASSLWGMGKTWAHAVQRCRVHAAFLRRGPPQRPGLPRRPLPTAPHIRPRGSLMSVEPADRPTAPKSPRDLLARTNLSLPVGRVKEKPAVAGEHQAEG